MKIKLVLVRHGYTVGNDLGLYTGWSNTMLSEKGIEDLKKYREEYAYPKTDRYYTSDLTRTIDTFKLIYGEQTPITESTFAFREIYFGDYEDVKWDEIPAEPYNEMYIGNTPHVNGETISQVSLRLLGKMTQVFSDMASKGEDSVTIVCHSGVIRTLIMFLKPLPFSDFYHIDTPNGLGYVLNIDFDNDNNYITLDNYKEIDKK